MRSAFLNVIAGSLAFGTARLLFMTRKSYHARTVCQSNRGGMVKADSPCHESRLRSTPGFPT